MFLGVYMNEVGGGSPPGQGQLPGIAFGPVPSRRLGQSLGINNIPHKICTYSCVYCQVGRTLRYASEPSEFFEPQAVAGAVAERVTQARSSNNPVDHLTFVPDGEPTLDINMGRVIDLLKPLGIDIAVITNGTLAGHEEAREALRKTDWLSFKIDAAEERTWRRIDRPNRALELETILQSLLEFRKDYGGTLVTETMLVRGMNDQPESLNGVARFLGRLKPEVAYISVPTRPPAESRVVRPTEESVAGAYGILAREAPRVELLSGYEGNAFACTGDPEEDLLAITAVHPMREEAVGELLKRNGAGWAVVERLVEKDLIVEAEYEGQRYYVRKFEPHLKRR
jgi:wyosine [tRNA(Phe)-imidazoG37] synthetase (radical SAM superfamily)